MEQIYDMIVIGGGPAGYTAALYAARSGLSVLVLEKLSAGGQMALTEQIDNYPGFEDGIDGFTLGEKMQQSAERFGAVTELAEVYKANLSGKAKTLETSEGVFQSRTVVIATGASPRPLGVPGEETLVGKGVHYCAAGDGARALSGQDRGGGGRRQLCRGGCPDPVPHCKKGLPHPPPRQPTGHQGIPCTADERAQRRILLEQHRFRSAARQPPDGASAKRRQHRRGTRPCL